MQVDGMFYAFLLPWEQILMSYLKTYGMNLEFNDESIGGQKQYQAELI